MLWRNIRINEEIWNHSFLNLLFCEFVLEIFQILLKCFFRIFKFFIDLEFTMNFYKLMGLLKFSFLDLHLLFSHWSHLLQFWIWVWIWEVWFRCCCFFLWLKFCYFFKLEFQRRGIIRWWWKKCIKPNFDLCMDNYDNIFKNLSWHVKSA